MKPNEWKEIADCVVKYIRNQLTAEERLKLEKWLQESEDNRQEFERLCSEAFVQEQRKAELSFSGDQAYRRFSKSLRRYRFARIWRAWGAVAAILMLGMVVGYYMWSGKESLPEGPQYISSGRSIARLTLGDGKVIDVGETIYDTIRNGGVTLNITEKEVVYCAEGEKVATDLNTLEVPRKGEFRLSLSDGSRVWLNSETTLRFPPVFAGEKREVYLAGEAYFEVASDSLHPFIVHLPRTYRVEVLGTSFNVQGYPEDRQYRTTLVQGKVKIAGVGQAVALRPAEQAVIDVEETQIEKTVVNVWPYVAWKEGRFVFRKERLENIMQRVERWYDVKIVYDTEDVKDITFSGNIERYENFAKIIEMLEITGRVKFSVEDNLIKISKNKSMFNSN